MRELSVADRDGIDRGLHEADLGRIASELGQLAAALEPEEAAVEFKLREEYISAERRLFLTRLERGQVLVGYKALYGPLRKWSAFCKIVNLSRQTAYDLLTVAGEVDRTVSVQSPRAARPAKKQTLTTVEAVDRATVAVERVLDLLPEQDRANALDKLVERLTSTHSDAAADRKAA